MLGLMRSIPLSGRRGKFSKLISVYHIRGQKSIVRSGDSHVPWSQDVIPLEYSCVIRSFSRPGVAFGDVRQMKPEFRAVVQDRAKAPHRPTLVAVYEMHRP